MAASTRACPLPLIITDAPSAASARAVAKPIPAVEPVTSAFLPFSWRSMNPSCLESTQLSPAIDFQQATPGGQNSTIPRISDKTGHELRFVTYDREASRVVQSGMAFQESLKMQVGVDSFAVVISDPAT